MLGYHSNGEYDDQCAYGHEPVLPCLVLEALPYVSDADKSDKLKYDERQSDYHEYLVAKQKEYKIRGHCAGPKFHKIILGMLIRYFQHVLAHLAYVNKDLFKIHGIANFILLNLRYLRI